MFTAEQIEIIVNAELATLLWSEHRVSPEGEDLGSFDDDYDSGDATPELRTELANELDYVNATCDADFTSDFARAAHGYAVMFATPESDPNGMNDTWLSMFGHDMALTRNSHGAGFWDRGLPGDAGEVLTAWAKSLGSLRVFDDFVEENAAEWAGMFHAE